MPSTWYVGELDLLGHRSDLLLQLLVSETHHLSFESGRQQLLLPGLTQAIDVALRREAAETVLHEGVQLPEHPDLPHGNDSLSFTDYTGGAGHQNTPGLSDKAANTTTTTGHSF